MADGYVPISHSFISIISVILCYLNHSHTYQLSAQPKRTIPAGADGVCGQILKLRVRLRTKSGLTPS